MELGNGGQETLWGYGGVDIFLFLSGMGLYHSLKKNSIDTFYKRRLQRILPSYLPFIIFWFLVRTFISVFITNDAFDTSVIGWLGFAREFLGNITGLGWFAAADNQFNWYISMLFLLYLAAPALYSFIQYVAEKKSRYVLLALLLIGISITFFQSHLLMGMSRIAIFTIGMLIAHLQSERPSGKVPMWLVYVLMIVGIIGLKYSHVNMADYLGWYGLYWFPFVLITPGLCALLASLFGFLDKNVVGNVILKVVEKIGNASFEIYLVHIAMFSFVVNLYFLNTPFLWKFWIPVSILCGMIYKEMIEFGKRICKKRS